VIAPLLMPGDVPVELPLVLEQIPHRCRRRSSRSYQSPLSQYHPLSRRLRRLRRLLLLRHLPLQTPRSSRTRKLPPKLVSKIYDGFLLFTKRKTITPRRRS
jgi:hypothetical protein